MEHPEKVGRRVSSYTRTLFGTIALFEYAGGYIYQDARGRPVGPACGTLDAAERYGRAKGWNVEVDSKKDWEAPEPAAAG